MTYPADSAHTEDSQRLALGVVAESGFTVPFSYFPVNSAALKEVLLNGRYLPARIAARGT